MIPVICKIKHNPPETYGDCIAACVGTILNRDDVPHTFTSLNGEECWFFLREWLAPLGLAPFITSYPGDLSFDEFMEHMKVNNPDSFYILLAKSGGNDHAVVCKAGKVIHNPSWYPEKITGPHSLGEWIVVVLGKI